MIAKKCDRCGQYYDTDDYIPMNIYEAIANGINNMLGYGHDIVYVVKKCNENETDLTSTSFDLCPQCNLKLRKFLEGEEVDPVTNEKEAVNEK